MFTKIRFPDTNFVTFKRLRRMVRITGIIGEDCKLINVMEQVANERGDTVRCIIDSPGGIAEEGLAIYDYLKGLNRKVVTVAQNQCGSIASVIFMAGEERIANCDIFIHNPFLGDVHAPFLTQDDLQDAVDYLEELKKKINDIYAKTSGVDKTGLQRLMDEETSITPQQAVSLGIATRTGNFVTENKYTPVAKSSNRVVIKALNKIKNQKTMKKVTLAQRIKNLLAGTAKNLDYTDVNGNVVSVEVPADRESQMPEVGDPASPDGSFELENGMVITVADGVVTEVVNEQAQNLDELKAENEHLKALLTEAQAKLEEYEAMEEEMSKSLNLKREFNGGKGGKTAFQKALEERKKNPKRLNGKE